MAKMQNVNLVNKTKVIRFLTNYRNSHFKDKKSEAWKVASEMINVAAHMRPDFSADDYTLVYPEEDEE